MGRAEKICLWRSSCRLTGILIDQMRGTCAVGSRQAEKKQSIWDTQKEEKEENFRLRKGGGDEATTTSVRNARDWQFRTGPLSTQRGGGGNVSDMQGWGGRQEALLSKKVHLVVHIVVGVSTRPGESELPRMGVDGVEESLE